MTVRRLSVLLTDACKTMNKALVIQIFWHCVITVFKEARASCHLLDVMYFKHLAHTSACNRCVLLFLQQHEHTDLYIFRYPCTKCPPELKKR